MEIIDHVLGIFEVFEFQKETPEYINKLEYDDWQLTILYPDAGIWTRLNWTSPATATGA